MKPEIGLGVYSMADAAALTGGNEATLRTWFRGRRKHAPIFSPDYSAVGAQQPLSFLDLIDALVMTRLRKMGFSLQYLRQIFKAAQTRATHKHGFAHRILCTNGGEILMAELDSADDHDKARLIDLVRPNQTVALNLLAPTLDDIKFGSKLFAYRWEPVPGIVVNPRVNLGTPTLEGTGIAARVLWDAWQANNRNTALVAEWYSIDEKRVTAAVDFIQRSPLKHAA